METLTDLTPYLARGAKTETDPRLVFEAPSLTLTVPLPPWSRLDDLNDTSGLIVIDHSLDVMITWDMDLPIDGYSRFRMVKRGEAPHNRSALYDATASTITDVGAQQGRRIYASDDGAQMCGVDLFPDPFRRAKTVVSVFCEKRLAQGHAYLRHLELFDGFDLEDEGAWPISRDDMMQRLERVMRLSAAPTGD